MTPQELPMRLGRIADALAARGAAAAANAMAGEFDRVLVGTTLRMRSHAPGTKTPSPPGQPPATITGTLRRSARITPAIPAGTRAVAVVRVTAVQARAQEKGAVIVARRAPVLGTPKAGFFGKQVTLPARPFMEPTRVATVGSGQLKRAGKTAMAIVIKEAGG